MIYKLTINTKSTKEVIDINEEVAKTIKKSKVTEGLLTVFTKHTTCAIIIFELEDDLQEDLLKFLNFTWQLGPYKHKHEQLTSYKYNSTASHTPAHILSAVIGQSRSIPIEKGQLQLGTWQKIALLELDGPRERKLIIQIL